MCQVGRLISGTWMGKIDFPNDIVEESGIDDVKVDSSSVWVPALLCETSSVLVSACVELGSF